MTPILPIALLLTVLPLILAQDELDERRACISQPRLICVFAPTTGNNVTGEVQFRPFYKKRRPATRRCLVNVTAQLRDLTPGPHGFHIHDFGDLRNGDGLAAGGHFGNPEGVPVLHGFQFSAQRHWGDFGNIFAKEDGTAVYRKNDKVISIPGILGRGMVLHALRDQGPAAQPTGASGGRQAHCVIGFANTAL